MIIGEAQSGSLLLPISHSCLALDVSRSGYYEWLKQSEKIPTENSESSDLNDQIQEIALEFHYYGYRRITAELQNRSYVVNHKRVLRLMRQEKLLCHKKKFKPVTTDSTHGLPIYPNF
jgi:putative transposase